MYSKNIKWFYPIFPLLRIFKKNLFLDEWKRFLHRKILYYTSELILRDMMLIYYTWMDYNVIYSLICYAITDMMMQKCDYIKVFYVVLNK